MDLHSIHLLLELSVTIACLGLSWIMFSNVNHGRYSLIMAAGFASATVATLVHIITMSTFHTSDAIIPLLGNLPQICILVAISLVAWCSSRHPCKNYTLFAIYGLTLIGGTLLGISQLTAGPGSMWDIPHISIYDITLYHPLQFILSIGWLIVGIFSFSYWKYIFPLCTSWAFFVCAFLASFLLSFTPTAYLEFSILISVALELAALYTIIIIYLVTNYHYLVFAHPPYMERRQNPQFYRTTYPELTNGIDGTTKRL